tara:strand:- start:218 stop:553 length:336 start_codon:yes stop_codon:yes gene_type:complete
MKVEVNLCALESRVTLSNVVMYPHRATLDLEGPGSALLMVDALNLDNDPWSSLVDDDEVSRAEDLCVAMNDVEDSAVRGGELGHGTLLSRRLGFISILHIHYRICGTLKSR